MMKSIQNKGQIVRSLGNAPVVDRNFSAEIGTSSGVVIAESVANGMLGSEDEEPVVREVKAELLGVVVVVPASLVAGAASTVIFLPGADAGRGYITVVLPGERVACSADGMPGFLFGGESIGQNGGAGD